MGVSVVYVLRVYPVVLFENRESWGMLNQQNTTVSDRLPADIAETFRQHGAVIPRDVDAVIISALDQSPESTIVQNSFVKRKDLVLAGITAIKRMVDPSVLIFAIPRGLKHVISRSDECAASIVVLNPDYPNGVPEVLAKRCALAGKKCAYIDTNRLADLMESFLSDQPVSKMHLSVGGTGIETRIVAIDVGSTVGAVLSDLEIRVEAGDKVLLGGVMRGESCTCLDEIIPANTECLFVQKAKQVVHFAMHSCLNCGKCIEVCPAQLQVSLISKYAEFSLFSMCRDLTPQVCVQCGLCGVVCIAGRPVSQLVQLAVQNIDSLADEAKTPSCNGGKTCPKNHPCC